MSDNPNPMPDSSPRLTIAAFVIIALAIIGGAVLLLSTRPETVKITINPPPPTPTPLATFTPAPITVYITGAVGEPESTISLPPGSRVQDAIDAVGGTTENANLEDAERGHSFPPRRVTPERTKMSALRKIEDAHVHTALAR